MKERCDSCRFYHPAEFNGLCRRYPPVILQGSHGARGSKWPKVEEHHWCGEYRPSSELRQLADVRKEA